MSIGIDSVGIDRMSASVSSLGANLEGFDPALAAQFDASLQSARQNNMTAGPRYALNDSPWQPDQTKTDAAPGVTTPPSDAPVAPPTNSQPTNSQPTNSQPPVNPYVRGAQETEEAWQQRVTDATNDAIHRYRSDPKAAAEDLRKINGAIAQSPGYVENYPAHAQYVSPDFFNNPTAYNVREVSDPVSEIPNVSDRIAHFTAANGSPFRAIAADGKVYDISRAEVSTDGHWTTSLYQHNDQMIQYNDQREKGPSADAFWAAAGIGGVRQTPGVGNWGTGPSRASARAVGQNEHILIDASQGLQSRTPGAGPFENIQTGTRPHAATKYLWTVDERGVNLAREKTPFPTARGNIVHTNLSERASIGGEAWFGPDNSVTINAGSGRFGDGAGITQQQWDAAVRLWETLGYKVNPLPFGQR